ncbi:hypothetical protein BJV82DRAFT_607438 [Fennellomyces sp. T-0311]|nr:hypothetical protein BJV82DRAFT_607438 [Fennellomyces sp. T-0311]
MSTPEEKFVQLVANKDAPVDIKVEEEIFNQLKPIEPSFLLGKWDGGFLEDGHAEIPGLKEIRWVGINFNSERDVEPVVVLNDAGEHVWYEPLGRAQLRQVVFRGVLSTAMVYDTIPTFDHIRYVTDDLVMGASDIKGSEDNGIFYFFLQRKKD